MAATSLPEPEPPTVALLRRTLEQASRLPDDLARAALGRVGHCWDSFDGVAGVVALARPRGAGGPRPRRGRAQIEDVARQLA